MADAPQIDICTFSGTGNTQYVADLYRCAFEARGCQVTMTPIEEIMLGRAPFPDGNGLLGVGYPVHALNAPRIVFDFLDGLPAGRGRRVFTFRTAGDSWMQGGATSMVRARLTARGYDVIHECLIVMPGNVMVAYRPQLVGQLARRAAELVPGAVDDILTGRRVLQENGTLIRLATIGFSAGERRGARFFGRSLRATDTCTRCELCARICPTGNIALEGDAVRFDGTCTLCMRCIYACPEGAIAPRILRFFVLRDGYDLAAMLVDPEAQEGAGDFVTAETRGWYGRMKAYLGIE